MQVEKKIIYVMILGVLLITGCSQEPVSDKEYYTKAQQYYDKGEKYAAIIELKNALKQNKKNAKARLLLGKVYIDLADGPNGEKELRRAIEYGEKSAEVVFLLVRTLILQNRFSDALKEITSVSAADEANQAVKLALETEAYLGLGDIDSARRSIVAALDKKSPSIPVFLAQAKFNIVTKQFAVAKQALDAALKINNDISEAWLLKAKLAEMQKNDADAELAYQQVLANSKKNRLTNREADAHISLALLFFRQNNIAKAREHIEIIYNINKAAHITNYLKGLLAFKEKNYEHANEFLQIAYKKNDEHPQTLLLLGAVSFALDQYNQAESFLVNYHSLYPNNLEANRLLGSVYVKLGDNRKAMEVFKKSLDYTQNDSQLLSMVGELAVSLGEFKTGEAYIRKAMLASGDVEKGHRQLASAYLSSGDYEAAIRELEALESSSGKGELAHKRTLVYAYLKNKQTQQALNKARSYVEENPDDAEAYNLLGAVYMARKDLVAADLQFNNALKRDANNKIALVNLARLSMAENNLVKARERLKTLLDNDDKNVTAMILMAQASDREGKIDQALVWLEKARKINDRFIPPRLLLTNHYFKNKDFKKAQIYLDEILTIQPTNQLALSMQIDIYLAQGDKGKSLEAALAFVKVAPKLPGAHTKLGQIYMYNDDEPNARKAFKQALKLRPGYYPASVAMARLEIKSGSAERALEYAATVQKYQPQSPVGYTLTGDIYSATKNYQRASQSYKQAMQRQESAAVVNKYAQALLLAGASWASIRHPVDNWLNKHPLDDTTRLKLAVLAREKGKLDESIKLYRTILKSRPNNAVVLNDLAWMLYESKKSKEAVKLAKRAYKLKPEGAAFQDTYGWILVQEGQTNEGLELITKAHQGLPTNPEVTYHYAYALHKMGKSDESKLVVNRLLEEHKSFNVRNDAEKLAAKLN